MYVIRTSKSVYFSIEYDNGVCYGVSLRNIGKDFYLHFFLKNPGFNNPIYDHNLSSEEEGNEILLSFYEDERNFELFLIREVLPNVATEPQYHS